MWSGAYPPPNLHSSSNDRMAFLSRAHYLENPAHRQDDSALQTFLFLHFTILYISFYHFYSYFCFANP